MVKISRKCLPPELVQELKEFGAKYITRDAAVGNVGETVWGDPTELYMWSRKPEVDGTAYRSRSGGYDCEMVPRKGNSYVDYDIPFTLGKGDIVKIVK